jgi:oxaloacetate decarboxylase gamma subunit
MSELMSGGINLMIMGMSTVFIFLALLVIGTKIMSFVIKQLPAAAVPEQGLTAVKPQSENSEVLTEVAAVAAAVRQFHKR